MKERRGFVTSEFLVVVVNSVVAVVIAAGYLTPEVGQDVVNSTVEVIKAVTELVGVLAPIVGTAYYVWSRTKVKTS